MNPTPFLLGCFLFLGSIAGYAANDTTLPDVTVVPLSDTVYMLQGKGGNLAFSSGPEGIILVDDQFAEMAPPILDALHKTGDGPVRVVINTHWHGDHTGGNLAMNDTGAVIVAHENVRLRLSQDTYMRFFKKQVKAAPAGARPLITFDDGLKMHINGDTLKVVHLPRAHTDGDAAVLFVEDNILHTGDVYFASGYPFIDVDSGGSLQGVIDATRALLSMCDERTRIVPGHGPLSDKAAFTRYLHMLEGVQETLRDYARRKVSVDEVVQAKPLASWSRTWGQGFIKEDAFIRLLYPQMLDAEE